MIYKIRSTNTGKFMGRNGFVNKGGRVYSSIAHVKTSFGKYASRRFDLEVVEYETKEVKVTNLTKLHEL